MAKPYPTDGHTKLWGASMTIAAIIVGLYLISLFYSSVVNEAARIDRDQEQAQVLQQR